MPHWPLSCLVTGAAKKWSDSQLPQWSTVILIWRLYICHTDIFLNRFQSFLEYLPGTFESGSVTGASYEPIKKK